MKPIAWALGLALAASAAGAQTYEVAWWTIDGGGVMRASGGVFAVSGTIGQPDAGGPFAGGVHGAHSGFWAVGLVDPHADLSVDLADSPDPVALGAGLTYAIRVANQGPATSPGTTLTGTLPGQVGFVSSSAGCAHAAGTVTCALGTLSAGSFVDVTIQVGVSPSATGVLAFTASASGGAPDPATANNSDTEATALRGTPFRGEIVHGLRHSADLAAVAGQPDLDLYRIRQEPRASYEVVLDAGSGDFGDAGAALERVAADGSTVLQASIPVGTGSARSLRFGNDTSSVVDDQLVRVRSLPCGSACGADDAYRLRAWETTGSIPRFNNTGSQLTIVLLQNAEASPITGRIDFWDASGALLHQHPVSLPPRGGLVLNTLTIVPLFGRSGSITIVHDGPYGGLTGKSVAIEPATGFSFDSPLEVRR